MRSESHGDPLSRSSTSTGYSSSPPSSSCIRPRSRHYPSGQLSTTSDPMGAESSGHYGESYDSAFAMKPPKRRRKENQVDLTFCVLRRKIHERKGPGRTRNTVRGHDYRPKQMHTRIRNLRQGAQRELIENASEGGDRSGSVKFFRHGPATKCFAAGRWSRHAWLPPSVGVLGFGMAYS